MIDLGGAGSRRDVEQGEGLPGTTAAVTIVHLARTCRSSR